MAQAVPRSSSISTTAKYVGELLVLRIIVATLDERATPPWWRTQLLTDFGFRAIARVFPRTATYVAAIQFSPQHG